MNTRKTVITNSCIGVSLVLAFAFPLNSEAKTLYVNGGTGNDSVTYAANSAGAPWRTIGRAAWGSTSPTAPNPGEAARAGDTVLVTAGTYTTTATRTTCGDGARWVVALNPANSGSGGNPITFRASGTVTILLASGFSGPTIGADGRNYIVWDGFTINEASASGVSCADTGPVVLHDTVGSQALNLSITGTYRAWGDNYNGIRLEAATNPLIRNNTIRWITCDFSTNCAGS